MQYKRDQTKISIENFVQEHRATKLSLMALITY